jgi:hypothetical protein
VPLTSHVCSGFSNTASSWMKAACLCHVYSLSHDGGSLRSFSIKTRERPFIGFSCGLFLVPCKAEWRGSMGFTGPNLGSFLDLFIYRTILQNSHEHYANSHEHHHIIECVHCCQVHAIVPLLLPIRKFRLARHNGP